MRSLPPLSIPLLLALGLAACGEPPPAPVAPPVVQTLIVGAAATLAERSYSGEVRARYETPLAFRVGGKLLERRVDVGARVARGQLLGRLDPADANLQAAQAESQEVLAVADAKRSRELRAQNFVSAAALDAKEAALRAAQSQAGLARNQAAYAGLTADQAGVISAVLAEPGQVVAAGQPVLRLARDGEREVAIALPEAALAATKPGQAAEVRLWSDGRRYRGRLRELSPAADPTTRTFAARVSLLDADAATPLGLSASVRFAGAGEARLTLPLAALFQQGDQPAVWLVGSDNALSLRPVKVGAYSDAGVAILEGLAAGERVVAAGVHKLAPGQKVRLAP